MSAIVEGGLGANEKVESLPHADTSVGYDPQPPDDLFDG
jgi:hypothetical protein